MFVDHLELVDFRSYRAVSLALRPGVNLLIGPNGYGKTNLVEAVEYLSTLGSHRVASDAPLLRAGTEQAIIHAVVVAGADDPRRLLLEIELNAGRPNRARINRVPQRRVRDLVGIIVHLPRDGAPGHTLTSGRSSGTGRRWPSPVMQLIQPHSGR